MLFILVKHQKQFKPGNLNSPPRRLQLPSDFSSNPELFEEGWEEMLAREEIHGNGTFYCCFKAGK